MSCTKDEHRTLPKWSECLDHTRKLQQLQQRIFFLAVFWLAELFPAAFRLILKIFSFAAKFGGLGSTTQAVFTAAVFNVNSGCMYSWFQSPVICILSILTAQIKTVCPLQLFFGQPLCHVRNNNNNNNNALSQANSCEKVKKKQSR